MKKIIPIIVAVAIVSASFPSFTLATTTPNSATTTKKAKLDSVSAKLRDRAEKEIDRRIEALNKLSQRIHEMKKITSENKSSLSTTIQSQINLLSNLKTKINADTDAATIKADVQSITKAYRVFALVLPQIEIMAQADKLASTTDSVQALFVKLQGRVVAFGNAGNDVTVLNQSLSDMKAKIADASVQSAKAIVDVSVLKPDNGDKTIQAANTKALKAARDAIKTGTKDLKDAQKDALKIRKVLKIKTGGEDATSTATSTSR